MAGRGRKFILDYFDVEKNAAVGLSILQHVASGGDPMEPVQACVGVPPGKLPVELIKDSTADTHGNFVSHK